MSSSSGQRALAKLFSNNQSEAEADLCAIIQTWINHKDSQQNVLDKLEWGDYTTDRLWTTLDDKNIINSIKNKDSGDLPPSVKKRMMAVRSFINTLQNEFGPISIGHPDYLKASKAQFDRFVMMYSWQAGPLWWGVGDEDVFVMQETRGCLCRHHIRCRLWWWYIRPRRERNPRSGQEGRVGHKGIPEPEGCQPVGQLWTTGPCFVYYEYTQDARHAWWGVHPWGWHREGAFQP